MTEPYSFQKSYPAAEPYQGGEQQSGPYPGGDQQSGYPQQWSGAAPAQVPLPPPSNVGWAVAAIVFFWPLAFSAFTHALNVQPAWAVGDYARALYSAERARKLGLLSIGIWVALFALFIVFYIVVFAVAISGSSAW